MKILYFSYGFGSPTTTFIRNETDYFSSKWPVKYVCTELFANAVKPDFVELVPFSENSFFSKIRNFLWKYDIACNFKNREFFKKINKVINEFKPDIIHCHFGYEALMLLDNLDNFKRHKIIIHFHGYDASMMTRRKSYVRRMKYYLSRKNVFTISCNQYFINHFINELSIKINKFYILHYGINVNDLFVPDESLNVESENIFIQVSSLVEKKGHEYTILAYKKFKESHPEVKSKLIFTGQGNRKDYLSNLVRELDLSDEVVFVGNLSPKDVAKELNKAKVFLHHSVTDIFGDKEGIPNAIMEAMSMELPIVSTYHSGIPELVQDGVNGYLVKEKDIDTYATKMADALKMGKLTVNRNKIINEFNLKNHNKKLSYIYQQIITS